MIRPVGFLNLLNPHVKTIKLVFNQILEAIRHRENRGNCAHEEREEGQADKFCKDGENILKLSSSRVVTIADSGDNLKYPVECKYELGVSRHVLESIIIYPRFSTGVLRVRITELVLAIALVSKNDPNTCQ